MTTLLAYAPALDHHLDGHPENAGRMRAIMSLLRQTGALSDLIEIELQPATTEQLARVHGAELIARVGDTSRHRLGRLDADTYVTRDSDRLARMAAGAVCAGVDALATGEADNGLALVRPPGHHAERNRVGGFCLFNNVAVAAKHAQQAHGLGRVLVVDFDVHHGNGTQDIFYRDESVLFVSLHLYHPFFYPGTGAADEIGAGSAQGATINVPFGASVGDKWYLEAFRRIVWPKARQFRPDLILVSAGFDAHWIDPLAAAALSLKGYARLTQELIQMADILCEGRILFVLEGGYHLQALSYGVLNVVFALTGQDRLEDPLGNPPSAEADMAGLMDKLERIHLL
jgi:acetoin utilization deacetylase AcuC-like enzyme